MIIDGHAHVFSSKIITNVSAKNTLVDRLHLQTSQARGRKNVSDLEEEARASGVKACLILPTANVAEISKVNNEFMQIAALSDFLFTAGTLHPHFAANRNELTRMQSKGVRAIKLCSFSQGFSLAEPEIQDLFKLIEEINTLPGGKFFVTLDTFYLAHEYFGTPAKHTTTPFLLGNIIKANPQINFVAAHMGGLAAPPEEIFQHLPPLKNLSLDTSNAAHTLSEKDFLRLLELHGPGHVIFGTDWPWFGHEGELELISRLLDKAGFNREEKNKVFCENIAGLLGIQT
jgi:hypothetical protein